jgi:hypothetical protein
MRQEMRPPLPQGPLPRDASGAVRAWVILSPPISDNRQSYARVDDDFNMEWSISISHQLGTKFSGDTSKSIVSPMELKHPIVWCRPKTVGISPWGPGLGVASRTAPGPSACRLVPLKTVESNSCPREFTSRNRGVVSLSTVFQGKIPTESGSHPTIFYGFQSTQANISDGATSAATGDAAVSGESRCSYPPPF